MGSSKTSKKVARKKISKKRTAKKMTRNEARAAYRRSKL